MQKVFFTNLIIKMEFCACVNSWLSIAAGGGGEQPLGCISARVKC